MSNIRPISDPAIATAMLASFQSIDAARSAPAGISQPRWRILQCIAKAAPNVPSPGELRMCSGLNKAALAEHVQALQWKGLLEMDSYRLSPSAAAMVGLEQPYAPQDATKMLIAADEGMAILPRDVTIIGLDLSNRPYVTAKVTGRHRPDGGFDIHAIEFDPPLDPADVPACMRPDCTPPELDHAISTSHIPGDRPDPANPQSKSRAEREKSRRWGDVPEKPESNKHGRGSAAVARPRTGAVRSDRLATDRITEVVAGSNPAPGQPAKPQISTPAAEPPKFVDWIEQRQRRLDSAIRFLKSMAILVTVVDRDAQVRQYFVSGKRDRKFAEEVIEIAMDKGWVE